MLSSSLPLQQEDAIRKIIKTDPCATYDFYFNVSGYDDFFRFIMNNFSPIVCTNPF